MNWLNNILDNEEVISSFRTGVIVLILLAIPVLGFLAFEPGFLSALWKMEIGLLGLLAVVDGKIAKMEIKRIAFEHEYKSNEELRNCDEELINANKEITNYALAARYVRDYNKGQQDNKNDIKTEIAINKLKAKIGMLTLRDTKFSMKKIKKLEYKVKKLQKLPLKDKKYKPVKVRKMLELHGVQVKGDMDGNNKYEYDYKGDPVVKQIIMFILKFTGFGGAAGLPLALDMPWQIILAYYAALIVSIAISSVLTYGKTRRRIKGPYLKTRINKAKFLKEMGAWVVAEETLLETKKAERLKQEEDGAKMAKDIEDRLAKEKEANLSAIQLDKEPAFGKGVDIALLTSELNKDYTPTE